MSSAVWSELATAAKSPVNLRQEFAQDPQRSQRFTAQACDLVLDYSKNLITQGIWDQLLALAASSDLDTKRAAMFAGARINNTEDRSV